MIHRTRFDGGRRVEAVEHLAGGEDDGLGASCGAGETVLGGGFRVVTASGSYKKLAAAQSYPSGNSWVVTLIALEGFNDTMTVTAYAICA